MKIYSFRTAEKLQQEANMSYKMRKKWCRNLFERPLFRELIPGAKAKDSFSLKIALRCLKWKQVGLCLVLGEESIWSEKRCGTLLQSQGRKVKNDDTIKAIRRECRIDL